MIFVGIFHEQIQIKKLSILRFINNANNININTYVINNFEFTILTNFNSVTINIYQKLE